MTESSIIKTKPRDEHPIEAIVLVTITLRNSFYFVAKTLVKVRIILIPLLASGYRKNIPLIFSQDVHSGLLRMTALLYSAGFLLTYGISKTPYDLGVIVEDTYPGNVISGILNGNGG